MTAPRNNSTTSWSHGEREARIDLAAAHRLAVRDGFDEGVCNHFTLSVPGTADQFFAIPYGLHWTEVSAGHFLKVSFAHAIVDGEGRVEDTAYFIHAPLHRLVPHGRCVLHTHMPFATALCSLEPGRLEPIGQTGSYVAAQTAYDDTYTGLAMDESEGERMAAVLGDRKILLHRHHGVMVVAETVSEAYSLLYYLERAARGQYLAMSSGRAVAPIPEPVLAAIAEQRRASHNQQGTPRHVLHFGALKRVLDREDPTYRCI